MVFVVTLMFFVMAFIVRCNEVLNLKTVASLPSALELEEGSDEGCYDTFFAEELEYL